MSESELPAGTSEETGMAAEAQVIQDEELLEEDEEHHETRNRTFTEKGLVWHRDRAVSHLRASISSWRRNATKLETLLSDSVDAASIIVARDEITTSMGSLGKSLEDLLLLGDVTEWHTRLDQIEEDHHSLMKRVSKRLMMIQDPMSDRRSHTSSKSIRTTSSSSLSSEKVRAAAKLAKAKVQLRHLQFEQEKEKEMLKIKSELGRYRLEKELEIAEATLQVVEEIEYMLSSVHDITSPDDTRVY